jgi:Helix-turn-helix domain
MTHVVKPAAALYLPTDDAYRVAAARRLRREYEQVGSIRAVAAKHGLKYTVAHKLLREADTTFYPQRGFRHTPSQPIPPDEGPIGQRLLHHRLKAGLSQNKLAAQLGISVPTVSATERGRIPCNRHVLDAMHDWVNQRAQLASGD